MSFSRRRTPALLAILRLSPPQFAHNVVAGDERVITKALSEGYAARVVYAFDRSLYAPLRINRRPNRTAVEVNVIFDFQAAHFVFEPIKGVVYRVGLFCFHLNLGRG